MDWITTVNGVIALITGLCGLVGTGIGAFFAIKAWIEAFKEKDSKAKWTLIVQMADAAIVEAERSGKSGAEKKEMVINAVKAGCAAAGVEVDGFIDQLAEYIDQCIKFVNDMNNKK